MTESQSHKRAKSKAAGNLGDALDKLGKTAVVNSRELWIATTQT